mgnify:CR=1 FL=1
MVHVKVRATFRKLVPGPTRTNHCTFVQVVERWVDQEGHLVESEQSAHAFEEAVAGALCGRFESLEWEAELVPVHETASV